MDEVQLVQSNPESVLENISQYRGALWEKINEFKGQMLSVKETIVHHTSEMQETMPLKHHIKDGIYTREIFMPKGMLVLSFIHKVNHPSFFLSGEMSILNDKAEVKRIKAPMVVQTEIGTQRVAYMHQDCVWVCTYRTDAKTVEEAEKELFTEDFNELPEHIIKEKIKLCQQQ
jgi:hypothetical protein|tara:strand:- start:600 stop:1118 length:519 start_codon:yes stop_codon:yes gene_type:complete